MPEGQQIPQTVLYAEGTVTYPPEMGIPDQHFVMRSANHPENGLPDTGSRCVCGSEWRGSPGCTCPDLGDSLGGSGTGAALASDPFAAAGMVPVQEQEGRPSDEELKEMAHGALHEARGERADDCPGPDCSLR